MVSLRGATLALLGGIVGTIGVGVAFTGCSGDDNGNPAEDAGSDVTTDSTADVATSDVTTTDVREGGGDVRVDVTPDAVSTDARDAAAEADARAPDADAGVLDADAGRLDADAGRMDADAAVIDADAGAIDADAGLVDADGGAQDADAADVKVLPPGLVAYPQEYAAAICTGFATCCGPTFDVVGCEGTLNKSGYDNTLPLSPNTVSAGNLTFNAGQANVCIAALQAWPCTATLSNAQSQAILTACHGVLGGTIPIGGTGCTSSFECVDGAYCGPGGTCTALSADGGACTPGESIDEQCSHIGTALPAEYCNIYPGDGGLTPLGTCAPALPNAVTSVCSDGVNFYSDYACTGRVCDFSGTGTCTAATANPADPATGFECSSYVLLDAGGD